MPAEVIDSPRMPQALGPYSQAVAVRGELVFISGQAGLDPADGAVPGDFEQQARNAFENLAKVLRAADLSMADVVKSTIYLTDPSHFDPLNDIFGTYFPTSPPTRAVPIVQLPKGLLISIETIAVRD